MPDRTPVGFRYLGIADGPATLTDYHQAWQLQREVHAQVAAGELGPQVLYVEHPPVYTAGRRTEPHERPLDGTPVVDVDRGGKITYHGPGQLVGYPIVFLPRGVGVVDYVRRIEEALIRLLAGYGIASGRVPGRTGVWLAAAEGRPERKIAAIGIRVSRQTTMHGFALNVTSDLADFGRIVPCGITDAGVTSMADELPLRSRSLTKGPLGPEQPIGLEDPGLRRDDHESRLAPSALSLLDVGRALEPHLVEMLRFEPFEQSPDLLREPASDTPAPLSEELREPASDTPVPLPEELREPASDTPVPLPEELREPASEASRRPTVRYGLLV